MRLGEEIKRLRREKGFTLRKLAQSAKVDYTYLSKIERGKVAPPSRPVLNRIAKALGVFPEGLSLLAHGGILNLLYETLPVVARMTAKIEIDRFRGLLERAVRRPGERGHIEDLETISTEFSASPAKSRWSILRILYMLIRPNLAFKLEDLAGVETFLRAGKRIVFVTKHQDLPSLVSFLLEYQSELRDLRGVVFMRSGTEDANEALGLLQGIPIKLTDILLPRRGAPNRKVLRALSLRRLIRVARSAAKGTVAVTVIERPKRRERSLSSAPIILAKRCGAVILPVVARSKIELVMERSWDKRRIPLSGGKVCVGRPFELSSGKGKEWRDMELWNLADELDQMDKKVADSIQPMQITIGL